MKATRVLLYAQLIAMYAMQTPLYLIMVLIRFPANDVLDNWVTGLLIASLVLEQLGNAGPLFHGKMPIAHKPFCDVAWQLHLASGIVGFFHKRQMLHLNGKFAKNE